MNRLLSAICLSAVLIAGGAFAQGNSFCGRSGAGEWSDIRDTLGGVWAIDHQAGYAVAGGMVIPFPASDENDTLTIAMFGDELVAAHPEGNVPLLLTPADEPRWVTDNTDGNVPRASLSPDDAALGYGCDQLEMPRILGTATFVIEGTPMDFTYRLLALSATQMYGILEVKGSAHGYAYIARRTVTMNRID